MSEPEDGKVGLKAASKSGAAPLTFDGPSYRPWSLSPRTLGRSWTALDLERKFLITAALTVLMSMAVLGYWVEQRIRTGWIRGMAETGAVYLESFLAPHVEALFGTGPEAEQAREDVRSLLSNSRLAERVAIIKLWDLNGELRFTTGKPAQHSKLDPDHIARIRTGEVIAEIEAGHPVTRLAQLGQGPPRFIEIYAPIYGQGSRNIVAIGEFYEYSQYLEGEISSVRYTTWFLILAVSAVIIGLLRLMVRKTGSLIVDQQRSLEANLTRAETLAKRNHALRRAADRARLDAAVLNESYLASIGADIHDGPIQILSLIMLRLPGASAPARSSGQTGRPVSLNEIRPLLQQALSELRNLSAGLVLPEIEELTAEETIALAIERHEQQTGTMVLRDIERAPGTVSRAIRVCAYRIVQEALNNAYKHAGGNGQRVTVRYESDLLEIVVSDRGPSPAPCVHRAEEAARLGLRGMESRIKALLGSLTVNKLANGGTEVRAVLPVRL